MKNDLLFVYGTLKKGCGANSLLETCEFLGTAITKSVYELYDCGSYPAMVKVELGEKIPGEIYLINPEIKEKLHAYEGVEYGLYHYQPIELNKISFSNLEFDKFINLTVHGYVFNGNFKNLSKISSWTCF
jgi:gamma-glutamylcyclotransferase (GGCT)/AIG2-like uncharacterized protein YtfP